MYQIVNEDNFYHHGRRVEKSAQQILFERKILNWISDLE
jgi:hypothetical protein